MDEGDSRLQVEGVDDVALALMQIHRAGVHRRRCLTRPGTAQHPPGVGFQDRDLSAGGAPDVHRRVRIHSRGGEVPAGTATQQTVVDQCGGDLLGAPGPHLSVGQRQLGRRAQQLRTQDVRVGRVDHHPFDGFVQQRCGMVHQVRVERIVAGDQNDQCALAAPARTAGLLPERCDGTREARKHNGIEAGDVDPELQRIGGGQSAQLAVGQRPFQSPTILGQVTGPIRRHLIGEIGVRVGQPCPGPECDEFGTPARAHERQRAGPLPHQVGHHPRRFGPCRAAYRSTVLPDQLRQQRRLPQRDRAGSLW